MRCPLLNQSQLLCITRFITRTNLPAPLGTRVLISLPPLLPRLLAAIGRGRGRPATADESTSLKRWALPYREVRITSGVFTNMGDSIVRLVDFWRSNLMTKRRHTLRHSCTATGEVFAAPAQPHLVIPRAAFPPFAALYADEAAMGFYRSNVFCRRAVYVTGRYFQGFGDLHFHQRKYLWHTPAHRHGSPSCRLFASTTLCRPALPRAGSACRCVFICNF